MPLSTLVEYRLKELPLVKGQHNDFQVWVFDELTGKPIDLALVGSFQGMMKKSPDLDAPIEFLVNGMVLDRANGILWFQVVPSQLLPYEAGTVLYFHVVLNFTDGQTQFVPSPPQKMVVVNSLGRP